MSQARAAGGHAMRAVRLLRGQHGMPRTLLARPGPSHTSPRTSSVRPPMRSRPHVLPRRKAEGEVAGRLECQWQRDQLPEAIRELVLDDQRLRNDICWSVFDC
jgi:hypothetical protein